MNTAVVNMELWVLQKGILVALVLAGLDARALGFGSCLGAEIKCCERLCASFCGSAPSLEPCTKNGALQGAVPCTRGWVLQGALYQEVGAAGRPASGGGCCRAPCARRWVLQGALHQEMGATGRHAMHQGVAGCHAVHQGHILPLTCWDFSHVGALCHVHPVGPWGFLAPPGTC